MALIDLNTLTIADAKKALHDKDISARELVGMYAEEIKKKDKGVHAYLEVFDDAFERAQEIDERLASGAEPRVLEGVPFAIKDNMLIRGKHASAASNILEPYIASYDAYVVEKLRDAGAVFLGRTNMDEFAMGSSTEHSAFGPTKNPHDTKRVPGGSSGGSAAAVSAGMALAALGSDTGGSIRQPAAFCGVVGMKPTYGAVSRSGLIAMASSLDQIGPLTGTVNDAELIYNVIRGKDEKDATTVSSKEHAKKEKLVIGIPKEYGLDTELVDADMKDVWMRAREVLEKEGHITKEVSLPYTSYALPLYYVIMPAEVSSNLARFDGVRYGFSHKGKNLLEMYEESRSKGFGGEAQRRILLGTYILSAGYYDAYYARAQKVRARFIADFKRVFGEVDMLLTPTTPSPAFAFGEKSDDPVKMYASDIFTVSANLAGVPALSVPFGTGERNGATLPFGMQLIAPWFGEPMLFDAGKALERYN
ncbi:MAG: Asp-tRNA(Asn)/Glu-tRNA(Gln) amidotransferase GatCAB subunit A [Candidatus Niyogibacteria bacterium CG10_big_fil_rev_8_21_14_0_10_46_36]|uniref:Glutamyl-tRNA(Gln) amidotransferase subunit A n=1 Tax=Candidatus Niyogibacteria bacterium CG10_big_fil_rev_8_21_14_0_10_46_36 TaxID=1974726 RepID=A0A2H0TDM8_9BACT|nr:MAG: Asp-tRNA(Asn)/Glu-tRNA(Gln) amidotransferase GatCAB subunit A [Candidatus Niyogibacteria bacterium CG10_big_fil_rev_8_21_14_0_10_46_36]